MLSLLLVLLSSYAWHVTILKIDSTKKVVKKLAGRPAKTAVKCTNVDGDSVCWLFQA